MGKKETAIENLKKAGNFATNPERINKTGANKGSKWNKNLLRDLATVPINTIGNEVFEKIKQRFPEFFDGSREENWQLFMEVKQISLLYHKDPKVSQQAIKEIKDRLEGRAIQKVESTNKNYDMSDDDIIRELEKLEAMHNDDEGTTGT